MDERHDPAFLAYLGLLAVLFVSAVAFLPAPAALLP